MVHWVYCVYCLSTAVLQPYSCQKALPQGFMALELYGTPEREEPPHCYECLSKITNRLNHTIIVDGCAFNFTKSTSNHQCYEGDVVEKGDEHLPKCAQPRWAGPPKKRSKSGDKTAVDGEIDSIALSVITVASVTAGLACIAFLCLRRRGRDGGGRDAPVDAQRFDDVVPHADFRDRDQELGEVAAAGALDRAGKESGDDPLDDDGELVTI